MYWHHFGDYVSIVLHANMCHSLLFQFHSSHNCVCGSRYRRVSDVWRVHDVAIHTQHATAVRSLENRHLDDGTRKPKPTDIYSTCIKKTDILLLIWSLRFQIVNPYTKYALTMTPVALSIEEALPKKMRNYIAGMCVRTALVLSTVVVALSFPYFGTYH